MYTVQEPTLSPDTSYGSDSESEKQIIEELPDDIIEGEYNSFEDVESIRILSNKDDILSKLPKLKKLVISRELKKSVVIPDTVEHLEIDWHYWYKLVIPPSVKYLRIGVQFAHTGTVIPRTIETLYLENYDELDVEFHFG